MGSTPGMSGDHFAVVGRPQPQEVVLYGIWISESLFRITNILARCNTSAARPRARLARGPIPFYSFVIPTVLGFCASKTYPAAAGLQAWPASMGIGKGGFLKALVKKTGCLIAGS